MYGTRPTEGDKNRNFRMAPMGPFSIFTLILRNRPMEAGEIVRMYVAQVPLANAHIGFGGPSPISTGGGK